MRLVVEERLDLGAQHVDAGKSGTNDKRCRMEARVAGRPPVTVTADADKTAAAVTDAVDKLTRMLDADLGRAKDRNGRDTIRAAQE